MSGPRLLNTPLFPWLVAITCAVAVAGCRSDEPAGAVIRPAIVVQAMANASEGATFYSGEVRARHESQLGFRVAGKIDRRLVDVGDQVETGQVLAVLDPSDLRLELAAGEAILASALADLELARSEYERAAALLERSLISQSQFEGQRTGLSAAQARHTQAEAQLAVRRNQLAYARLQADRAGVITAVQMEAGQVVAAGQTVAVLAELDELEVEIALPEAQVAQHRAGDPALIRLWSQPELSHEGRIREIAPDADPASRTYRARVGFVTPDPGVQLGLTARVQFRNGDEAAGWQVPLSALHVDDEGRPAVWVVDRDSHAVSLRPVQIGRYREDAAEILSGLSAGDWLVAVGVHTLQPGQRVRPIDRDNRPVRF